MAGEVGIEPTYHGFGDQAISNYRYSPIFYKISGLMCFLRKSRKPSHDFLYIK